MKLFVISDTHGNIKLALKAHSRSERIDVIVHLGDGFSDADLMRELLDEDVINVAGNCDLGSSAPRELLWECEGKRILLTHGDAYRVKAGLEKLKRRALEVKADLVLFGHSHLATHELHSGILFLNPGTMMSSALQKSYAIVDVSQDGTSASLHDIS
ncbi:MAG: metallophosphoesterase [Desulfuromonadaceae bacterium]|nr:metallophosphoesterase [Desulfuromonadaceae bacterium]